MTRKMNEGIIAVIALAAILSIGTIAAVMPQQALATDHKNDKEFKKDDGGDKNTNTGNGGDGGYGVGIGSGGTSGAEADGGNGNGNGVHNSGNGNAGAHSSADGTGIGIGGHGGDVHTGSSHKTDKCKFCSS